MRVGKQILFLKIGIIANYYSLIPKRHFNSLNCYFLKHSLHLKVYELEVMPVDMTNLGNSYVAGTLYELDKWFNEPEKVGVNRPLMHDFTELAKSNVHSNMASICFLISLNHYGENEEPFRLKLLKGGQTIVENFRAPKEVMEMEVIGKAVNQVELSIHGKYNQLELESSYHIIESNYESINTDVSNHF